MHDKYICLLHFTCTFSNVIFSIIIIFILLTVIKNLLLFLNIYEHIAYRYIMTAQQLQADGRLQ